MMRRVLVTGGTGTLGRRVIEAATAMFSEHGLDVGVADIAQRAGVGRGTLFRNFPSKDDLVAAVVVDRIQESTVCTRSAAR